MAKAGLKAIFVCEAAKIGKLDNSGSKSTASEGPSDAE